MPVAQEGIEMSSRMTRCAVLWVATIAVLAVLTAQQAMAQSSVPIKLAVQTTVNPSTVGIGPADAPVRSAVFTPADRKQVTVQPVHWFGPRYSYGYAPYYAGYAAPYYGYGAYPAPYIAAYPAPYVSYFRAPYYAYPPVYSYRIAPRRAFYSGGYYW
jgi:hypothetical protein